MSCECSAVDFESKLAMEDVRRTVCRYGKKIKIHGLPALPIIGGDPVIGENTEVGRDKYGAIIDRSPVSIEVNAFPIDTSPSTKQLQKVGMVEQMDAIAYLSTKQVNQKGYTFDDFDVEKCIVNFDNIDYKIKDRREHSEFKNVHLYIVLGLRRN